MTPKERIRQMWLERANDDDSFEEAIAQVVRIIRKDTKFCVEFFNEALTAEVRRIGTQVLIAIEEEHERGESPAVRARREARLPARRVTIADIKAELQQTGSTSTWSAWISTKKNTEFYMALVGMSKADVLIQASQRRSRALGEMTRAEWMRLIAEPMKEGQTVADAWTPAQLDELKENLRVSYQTRMAAPGSLPLGLRSGDPQGDDE